MAQDDSRCRVQVGVRLRPFLGLELSSRSRCCVFPTGRNQLKIGEERIFTYDSVFPIETTQEGFLRENFFPFSFSLQETRNQFHFI